MPLDLTPTKDPLSKASDKQSEKLAEVQEAQFLGQPVSEPTKTAAGFMPENEIELDRSDRLGVITDNDRASQEHIEEGSAFTRSLTSKSRFSSPSFSPSSEKVLKTFFVYDTDTVREAEILSDGDNPDSFNLLVDGLSQQSHTHTRSRSPEAREFPNVRRGTHKRDVGTFYQEEVSKTEGDLEARAKADDENQAKIDLDRAKEDRKEDRRDKEFEAVV